MLQHDGWKTNCQNSSIKITWYGIYCARYNAVTTDSIYLKLDYGVCCEIRIDDHNWKKKYHYRFNVVKDYCGDKII